MLKQSATSKVTDQGLAADQDALRQGMAAIQRGQAPEARVLRHEPDAVAVAREVGFTAAVEEHHVVGERLRPQSTAKVVVARQPRIDDDYYLVDGEPKRFFDRAAATRLFARGWRTLSLEEGVIDRYDHPKWVWETILEKVD